MTTLGKGSATARGRSKGRRRGSIDQLPGGNYRVRVHAGQDPLTGGRHTLVEIVDTLKDAEKARTRLLAEVDERRNPRTKATMGKLLDRYLEVLDVEAATRKAYEGYIRNHIRPALGDLQVGELDGEILDRFYAQLRRCRRRCGGKSGLVDHRVTKEHRCDVRCRPHECKPMQAATVRQIHFILAGAFNRAVRWRWITTNPVEAAAPPSAPRPNPKPPTPEEAVQLLEAAWAEDETWGTLIWLALVTGARRGELCAIRRSYVDLERAVLTLPRSVSELDRREKETKTHQQRRIALDQDTIGVLRSHFEHLDEKARSLGVEPAADAFLFSYSPSGDEPMSPSGVTHRYGRMSERLNIVTSLHKLRHYNATELIAAGVDIRTVAGRLGHGGGGTTTLRVYSAWVSEADQRAASQLSQRLPRPGRRDRDTPST